VRYRTTRDGGKLVKCKVGRTKKGLCTCFDHACPDVWHRGANCRRKKIWPVRGHLLCRGFAVPGPPPGVRIQHICYSIRGRARVQHARCSFCSDTLYDGVRYGSKYNPPSCSGPTTAHNSTRDEGAGFKGPWVPESALHFRNRQGGGKR
jgi:hypothetical protein